MESGRKTALALFLAAISVAPLAGCGQGESAAPEPPASTAAQDRLPAGKYLYLAGDHHLTIVDVDASRSWTAKRPRLAPGDPPLRILRRGDRLVYYGPGGYIDSVDLNLLQRPRRLGGPGFFLASPNPDRVWVAEQRPKAPTTSGDLEEVREVTAAGDLTFRRDLPTGGPWPLVALRAGFGVAAGNGVGLDIWDPHDNLIVKRVRTGGLGPAFEDLLVRGSLSGRHLHLTNVVTGADHSIPLPHGRVAPDWSAAAFSPDGKLLAVPVVRNDKSEGIYSARWLALVDVATRATRIVRGSRVSFGDGFITWASDGRTVFMSRGGINRRSPRQIVIYRLGDREAHAIQIRFHAFFGMAAS